MIKKLIFSIIIFSNVLNAVNNLAKETSPYLLQHKDNPVNWYAWGEEAFKEAKKQNKHIFLSIGYSTCHWCHVMAHESFEDEEMAKLLNENYISIKIDKEQYPHIDKYYQNVFRLMNKRSGGWPLSIFLTSDKKTFYSATYIPKEDAYGRIGFKNLLNKIKTIPKSSIQNGASRIQKAVKLSQKRHKKLLEVDENLDTNVVSDMKKTYDFVNNGFGKSRKFPEANKIKLLLKIYQMNKNKDALSMATKALTTMAKSGIYDQIDGAFYRYTVDAGWKIPHFEKMLYTNAELIEVYTLAYKITKNELYKKVVSKTIKEIDRRFKVNNVYQSASNADSKNENGHNEEGAYFVFQYDDVLEYLETIGYKENIAKLHLEYLSITSMGNFETDLSNPIISSSKEPENISKTIELLQKFRQNKEYPFIDNKINTAWNSMYLKSKIEASYINETYLPEALSSLDSLTNKMYIDGELYHQTIKKIKPTQKALLEDYSFLSSALFSAYQKTLNQKYFKLYEKLINQSINKFYKDNKWIDSQDSFKTFANMDGNSYASPLANHVINIINYSSLKAKTKIYKVAKDTLDEFSYDINTYPSYFITGSLATLMQKYEPVFVKAKVDKLRQISAEKINYPFVYFYEDEAELYLACKINTCFSFDQKFPKVKNDIENLLDFK